MSEVNITVVGNVATEPKLDRNKNGDAFAHFRLACNNARYDARTRSWVDDDTSFYTVYCWRSPLADNIAASSHELAGDVKADKARRARDEYCLIRHITSRYRFGFAGPAEASLPVALRVSQYPVVRLLPDRL